MEKRRVEEDGPKVLLADAAGANFGVHASALGCARAAARAARSHHGGCIPFSRAKDEMPRGESRRERAAEG